MKKTIDRLLVPVASLVATFGFTSCAAMFTGTSQSVVLNSSTPKSSVTIEGQKYSLPATAQISKKTTTATFTNPAHPTKVLTWERDFQVGFLLLDFLFTPGYGIVGMLVDSNTAAWYKQPGIIDYDFTTGKTSVKEVANKTTGTAPSAQAPTPTPKRSSRNARR
jgi:hypothetical protein